MSSTTIASTVMKTEAPPPVTLLMLPNDLIFNCLARISRSYYPTLTLVSKSFRSFLNSPELYETRSLLYRTESCLYVCLQSQDGKTHWYTLCRKPYVDSSKMNKSSDNILVPNSCLDTLPLDKSGVVAHGSKIYAIGGSTEDAFSSSVFFMEPHSHTWCKTSNMHVARVSPCACVLDGKRYVTGGCKDQDSLNWMEVLDTKTQTWEFAPSPSEKVRGSFRYESIGLEGSVYVTSQEKRATFKLNKGRWREAELSLNRGWYLCSHEWGLSSCCVIDSVFYSYAYGYIKYYDMNERIWRYVEGLEGKLPRFSKIGYSQLAEHGGKLAFLWKEYVSPKNAQNTTIWCAEIELEKRERWEICGKVVWFGVVFTNTRQYNLMHVLATTA